MRTKTPLLQATTTWVHTVFRSLRKPARTNLALFLSALLSGPLDPTLSDLARRTPLPTLAQSRLNRLWRFLHHPTCKTPGPSRPTSFPSWHPASPKETCSPSSWTGPQGRMASTRSWWPPSPKGGRALRFAFALHSLSPFPARTGWREAFFHRLGREVQALGYVPLFLLDRGFDRLSLMRRLQEWGMGFLIRLRRNREVETETGSASSWGSATRGAQARAPAGPSLWAGREVGLFLAQGKREPWYLRPFGRLGTGSPVGTACGCG